jgi:hypothetical protein
MRTSRLALLAVICALLAFPGFYVGAVIGDHIGSDGESEGALIGAAVAVVLALGFGIAAAYHGGRPGVIALVIGFVAVAAFVWYALELIAGSA